MRLKIFKSPELHGVVMKSKCVDLELFGDSGYIVTLVSQVNNTKMCKYKIDS